LAHELLDIGVTSVISSSEAFSCEEKKLFDISNPEKATRDIKKFDDFIFVI